jgi:hypothetical protein
MWSPTEYVVSTGDLAPLTIEREMSFADGQRSSINGGLAGLRHRLTGHSPKVKLKL